jgi:membrane protein DedA with SNARE-associated domain
MKKILAALVLASFLGAGLTYAQGTTAPKPEATKCVKKHCGHHKGHKKAEAKTTPVVVK